MKYLKEQLSLHPSMQMQDVAKFCYQAVFGAEHLLCEPERAKKWLYDEFESTPATDESLYENISEQYCRVNLGSWKAKGFNAEALFDLFYQTASTKSASNAQDLENMLTSVRALAKANQLPFSEKDWLTFLSQYDRRSLHHSEQYRIMEKPAYRVILRELVDLSILCR